MKTVFAAFLLLLSSQVFAGGASVEVELLSLTETREDKYILKYRNIESDEIYKIYLSYDKGRYIVNPKLTHDKYTAAISLLKKQLKQKIPVRFGWFARGPCLINKSKNIYRSDALKIYEENYPDKAQVVYAFCQYR